MRAKQLVIWAEQYKTDEESKIGADGLYNKSLSKCGNVALWEGCPATFERSAEGLTSSKGYNDEIGVYAVFHSLDPSFGPAFGTINGEQFVQSVLIPMLGEDIERISKLVFLACFLSPDQETIGAVAGKTLPEVTLVNAKQTSFMLDVILTLSARGIRPSIVGWDSFVSILPAQPSGNRNVYDAAHTTALTGDQMTGEMSGKKYIQYPHKKSARFGLVTPPFRESHKRTFSVTEGGKVQVTGPGGWSEG